MTKAILKPAKQKLIHQDSDQPKLLMMQSFVLNLLSMKLIMLIQFNMPTNVGILTFISMINTTSERLKARNFFIRQYFSFYE